MKSKPFDLNLLQVVTRSAGQTGVNVGGEFVSNPVSVNVSSQTIYAPLKPGNPFVHLIGVDVRIHGPRQRRTSRLDTNAHPQRELRRPAMITTYDHSPN